MRGFIAPTDHDWYRFLRARPQLDEVNFWRPSAAPFKALSPGEPFFFKLKAPHNAIGGFGQFLRAQKLPIWRAWDVFGEANGVADEFALRERLANLSKDLRGGYTWDRVITCIVVSAPVFFSPDDWVALPRDWGRQIVQGKGYDLTAGEGRRIWEECLARVRAADLPGPELDPQPSTGTPHLVAPRLGQGSFRLAVLEAYGGQCGVTTEHSLPALEAAHIRPWSQGGRHELSNGLPLRRDLHRLFDLGFVTVRPGPVVRGQPAPARGLGEREGLLRTRGPRDPAALDRRRDPFPGSSRMAPRRGVPGTLRSAGGPCLR